MNYKFDDYIDRKMVQEKRKFPKKPLSEEEKQELTDKYLNAFIKDYANRMVNSKCLTGSEYVEVKNDYRSLAGEAYELFHDVLESFDKASKKWKNQTIAEYFEKYYRWRIYNKAGETIARKIEKAKPCKPRGNKSKDKQKMDHYRQLVKNWEENQDQGIFVLPDYEQEDEYVPGHIDMFTAESELMQDILNHLENMPRNYQVYFVSRYRLRFNYQELKAEFSEDEYEELKAMDKEFIKKFDYLIRSRRNAA